jgi:phage terminase large subunit-like protein
MEGQDSPDRMDALVHAITELARASGAVELTAARGQLPGVGPRGGWGQ